jgi:hypothetical protein
VLSWNLRLGSGVLIMKLGIKRYKPKLIYTYSGFDVEMSLDKEGKYMLYSEHVREEPPFPHGNDYIMYEHGRAKGVF